MLKELDPRTPDYLLAQGDTARTLDIQLVSGGKPVDLTLATNVVINIKPKESLLPASQYICSFLDRVNGTVRHIFPDNSTTVPGDYLIGYTVTWSGGTRSSYPVDKYSNILMRIVPTR